MTQLPQGWKLTNIKSVTKKTSQNKPTEDEELVYVDIGSIDRDLKKISSPQKLIGKDAPSRCRKRINTNDILVSLTRPNLNAVAIVGEEHDDQYASTGFDVLKPNGVHPKFLYYLVRTQNFVNSISGQVQGALYPAAKASDVQAYEFAMPEFEEQKRIANKLDLVLGKVETAQARLDKIPTILKRFRQSVLAAATTGELTKEWRQSNGLEEWEQVKLKDVGKGFNYGSSAKSQPEGKVPVLRMGNLQGGKLDWENLVFTSDGAEIEKYKLQSGDVLFNRTNSPELVGKTSIYRGEREAIFAGYLIKVQGSDRLNTEYLNIQLNSPHARNYCWAVKTDGVSQSNINAKKLQAYEFELPSIKEQEEIIRVVTELFSNADLVEKQYKAAKLRVDKLTQSILAKAFSGKLFSPISEDDREAIVVKKQSSQAKAEKTEVAQEKIKAQADKIENKLRSQVKVEPTPTPDNNSAQAGEVLSLLKSNNKGMSAQALFDGLSDNTFSAIDDLFSELKKLIEQKVVIQAGEGENSTFKVIKK